jgi:hypothetical protein
VLFLGRPTFRRVPSYQDPQNGSDHRFPGKLDGPFETPVHPPDVEARRPDEDVKLLATEGGANELLAGLHLLRRGLGKQEPAEDLFQLAHILDWRRRAARREVLELNLAAG